MCLITLRTKLPTAGGRLHLTGLEPPLLEPLAKASRLEDGNDRLLYAGISMGGHSTRKAVGDARALRYAAGAGGE